MILNIKFVLQMKETKSCSKTRQLYMTRRVAAHTQVRECALIIFTHTHTHTHTQKEEKKRKKKRREYYLCLCRIVPVQLLLIMSTQSNIKSFIKYA